MKIVAISLILLTAFGIAFGLYFFRYAAEPAVWYNDETGVTLFGYDKQHDRWLINEVRDYDLGIDGPHIFYHPGGKAEIVYVKESGERFGLTREAFRRDRHDSLKCMVHNVDRNLFSFKLKDSLTTAPSVYPAPGKLLAISDIEGNFQAFAKLLIGNGVVDKNLNWIFGDGHLVLVGDFMDRGENVTQCLWLIYKLEDESKLAGGQVHFILGNHEQLNLQGSISYVAPKYRQLVRDLNIPYKSLFDANTELGRWLRTKNVIEKIGGNVFVHGGISPEVASMQISIPEMNDRVRTAIDVKQDQVGESGTGLLLGRKGILWYRGLVQDYKDYKLISNSALDTVLSAFQAARIIVGHTIVNAVSADFQGRVIRLDVKHSEGKPQALFIEAEKLYRTDAQGNKETL